MILKLRKNGFIIDGIKDQRINQVKNKSPLKKKPTYTFSLNRFQNRWADTRKNDKPVTLKDYETIGGIEGMS